MNTLLNDVLVVVAGHVESEHKKNHVIDLLNHIKQEGFKLCYVTHSDHCLSEISEKTDFLYYDKNNLLIEQNDYYKNIDLFDDTYTEYGICQFQSYFTHGILKINGIAAHCPALTILLKNAIDVANINNFKWIVFLEYDITIPKFGFYNFIKDKIHDLYTNNKKCILYPRNKDGFIYPGILIFSPIEIHEHPIFLKKNWYESVKNWIFFWKMGFSETVTDHVLRYVFNNKILEHSIENDAKKYWDVEDYSKIHKYSAFDNAHRQVITLVPSKNENILSLHIFCLNLNNFKIEINDLYIENETKNNIIYKNNNKLIESSCWYLDTINCTSYNEDDIINLNYSVKIYTDTNFVTLQKSQKFQMRYLNEIYKYVCKIEFNKN